MTYNVGDAVRITEGELAGREGQVVDIFDRHEMPSAWIYEVELFGPEFESGCFMALALDPLPEVH